MQDSRLEVWKRNNILTGKHAWLPRGSKGCVISLNMAQMSSSYELQQQTDVFIKPWKVLTQSLITLLFPWKQPRASSMIRAHSRQTHASGMKTRAWICKGHYSVCLWPLLRGCEHNMCSLTRRGSSLLRIRRVSGALSSPSPVATVTLRVLSPVIWQSALLLH